MQDYYEDLWERLPEELAPPDLERRRRYLLAEARAGERVLDLGCGTGELTAALALAGAHAIGIEVARAALRRARAEHPGLDFRLAPLGGPLPLADGCLDLVFSSEVIEHVADTASWLSEIRRVLAPGGRVLVTTPSHGRLRIALRGVDRYSEPLGDHLHLYTKRSLGSVLEALGFVEVRVRAVAGPPLWRRMLLARAVR
ncbi:MAG: class I SAM-dependent methyltransferase [Solirubrobacteraceae bacterium]